MHEQIYRLSIAVYLHDLEEVLTEVEGLADSYWVGLAVVVESVCLDVHVL